MESLREGLIQHVGIPSHPKSLCHDLINALATYALYPKRTGQI